MKKNSLLSKIINYTCFVFSAITFCLCIACIVGFIEGGLYDVDQDDYLYDSKKMYIGRSIVNELDNQDNEQYYLFLLDKYNCQVISHTNGEIIYEAPNFKVPGKNAEKYTFYVLSTPSNSLKYNIWQSVNGDYDYVVITNINYKDVVYAKGLVAIAIQTLAFKLQFAVYPIAFLCLFICAVIYFSLLASNRIVADEHDFMHKIPIDLLVCILLLIGYICYLLTYVSRAAFFIGGSIGAIGFICCFLLISELTVYEIYNHSFLKSLIIYNIFATIFKAIHMVLHWFLDVYENIPLIFKGFLLVTAFFIFIFISLPLIFNRGIEVGLLQILLVLCLIIYTYLLKIIISYKKIADAAQALSEGASETNIDTKKLASILRPLGANLNNISDGINKAVLEKMKSERMKTELITNVSHDLKTPLTSIINYASLIDKEETTNENIKTYSEVLVRQSSKLKRLIEDLVEASKATTGNLEVNLLLCDPAILLNQISGEYADRFVENNLELITHFTTDNIQIMADSRRMWRVFDNITNNIVKYSLPGSRVYIDLIHDKQDAIFTFKNTSKASLNISADELMERFVRGDSSRNTEGNGLGLSIARSLVELQNGSFKIDIDGDLFKVTLKFPLIKQD